MKKKLLVLLLMIVLVAGIAIAINNRDFFHRPEKDSIVHDEDWKEADKVAEEQSKNIEKTKTDSGDNSADNLVEREVLFLLVGIDKNDETDDLSASSRTDTLILTKVNFDKGTIDFINIPRDTRVPVNGQLDKINHAHAYGGMPLTLRTVEDFLGIELDKYIKLSFESVKYIVDTIGGVDVNLNSAVASSLGLPEGINHLDGTNALKFVRYRKGYQDGDIGRVKSQQQFLLSVGKQCLSPENLIKLPSIYNAVKAYMDTNIGNTSILDWMSLAKNLKSDKLTTTIIEGNAEYIDGISYWIPEDASVDKVVNEKLKVYVR